MFYSTALVAALAGLASAAPAPKRRAISDATILNYALTLEHLESKFYREGLANYTREDFMAAGFAEPFHSNLMKVSFDEDSHVAFLTAALQKAGYQATAECTYRFGVTTPKEFVALASVLEGVGVSAYLGAAALIADPNYLTAAGSILTVEARHSAYLRQQLGEAPFPQPFDTPLDLDEVHSLASPFIVSCPSSNPPLPVRAFPRLALGTAGPIVTGEVILLQTPGYTLMPSAGQDRLYAAFISVTGPVFVDATPVDGGFAVRVPEGFAGQTYVVISSCKGKVTDETTAAGPAIVEIAGSLG